MSFPKQDGKRKHPYENFKGINTWKGVYLLKVKLKSVLFVLCKVSL